MSDCSWFGGYGGGCYGYPPGYPVVVPPSVPGLSGLDATSSLVTPGDTGVTQQVGDAIGSRVKKSGDTMTGRLVLAFDPVGNLEPASKQYVDAARLGLVAGVTSLSLSSISFSGYLTGSGIGKFDIRFYGAVCDGATDDAPAIQLAVNAAVANGGGDVVFPPKRILWNSQVIVSGAAVHLRGRGWSEDCSSGTRILTTSTLATPLLVQGTAARGGSCTRMSFQQTQPAPGAGWSPTAYPFTIDIENMAGEFRIDDLFFYNCYNCVRSQNSGRTDIGKLRGQPLNVGLWIDGSYDTTHVGDIHFWPYWSQDASVITWQQANADVIRLFRVDGFQAPRIFCLGYRSGIRMSYSAVFTPPGSVSLAQIGSFYPDACKYGILMDGFGASCHIESIYTGSERLDGSAITNAFAIYMQSSGCTLSIANAKLYYVKDQMIVIDQVGGANVLQIGNLEVNNFNSAGLNETAIFSANASVPNVVSVANAVNVVNSNGARLINDCNAFFSCPNDTPYQVFPTNGQTVTFSPSHPEMFIEPAGPLASLTVVLPATYIPNGIITVLSTQAIASVTFTAGGALFAGLPTSLSISKAQRFKFFSNTITAEGPNAWYAL